MFNVKILEELTRAEECVIFILWELEQVVVSWLIQ